MRRFATFLLFLSSCALFGCGSERSGDVDWIELPAPPSSSHPAIARADDALIVSWIEPRSAGAGALRFARRTAEGWDGPSGIGGSASDPMVRPNWSDPPRITLLENGDRVAVWSRTSGKTNSFDAILSRSPGREAWAEGGIIGGGRGDGQRGWTTVIPFAGGAFGLAWLDLGGGTTRLLYQRWEGKTPGPVETLDEDVCPWCRVSGVSIEGRPVLAFRDHGPDELRDVALIRRGSGGWTDAETIHADGWITAGCPVSGPALATSGSSLAAAWFSASDDTPRVVVATSRDGSGFGPPLRVDGGDPVGRVALEGWTDGSLFVSWIERVGSAAEVRLRRIAPDGEPDAPLTLGRTEAGTTAGLPSMGRDNDHVYVAWTRPGSPSSVRLFSIRP